MNTYVASLGKGPGYVLIALVEVVLCAVLAYVKPDTDWTGFAMVLGAINAGVYGGGSVKAWADSKVSSAGSVSTSAS